MHTVDDDDDTYRKIIFRASHCLSLSRTEMGGRKNLHFLRNKIHRESRYDMHEGSNSSIAVGIAIKNARS